jgi:hypothetical protein
LTDVEMEIERISKSLSIEPAFAEPLAVAARWHDIGKFFALLAGRAGVQGRNLG